MKSTSSIREALSWERISGKAGGTLSGFGPGLSLVLPESAPGKRSASLPLSSICPDLLREVNFFSVSETQVAESAELL